MNDTIAAISTPPGKGGVAIIRISGDEAISIAERVFFPKSKAKVTSIYMMMGGLANFVIPLITGYLSNIGLQYIIVLDFTFALLALITAIIVFIRYYRVFIIPENDVRFGERKFSTRLNTIKHRG